MRFYLTGHRTFGNRGCEAIVRSTVLLLRREFGDVTVLVPSDNITRDYSQWPQAATMGVCFVRAYFPWFTRYWVNLQRIPLSFFKQAIWPFPFPGWLKKQISSVDVVLSVGGDNYSLSYRLPSLLMGIDRLAINLGKPVYLWGASVGPFESEPQFLPVIRRHLAGFARIMVRESISRKYLLEVLSLDNVTQMADPAFTLRAEPIDCSLFWPREGNRGVIGLNVSSLLERYKSPKQDLIHQMALFVRDCVCTGGFSVILIPHVGSQDCSDKSSDWHYMRAILQRCEDLGSAVTMAPPSLNAAQLKYIISRVRFFIGARTHSTIAALSSGVPTVAIAYSTKAQGINEDTLGDKCTVLFTPDLSANSLWEKLNFLQANEILIKEKINLKLSKYVFLVQQHVGLLHRSS